MGDIENPITPNLYGVGSGRGGKGGKGPGNIGNGGRGAKNPEKTVF